MRVEDVYESVRVRVCVLRVRGCVKGCEDVSVCEDVRGRV